MARNEFLSFEPLESLMQEVSQVFPERLQYMEALEKEYADELLRPIYLYDPLPVNEVMSQEWHTVQMSQKLLSLFKHFNIKPNRPESFTLLAMALCEKTILGFKVDTLEDKPARENWNAFVYYLEIRWIKHSEGYKYVKDAIRHWLHIKAIDVNANIGSKEVEYYAVQNKHRVLIDTRNSLNPKARGQLEDYTTPIKEIPEDILDQHLFDAFSNHLNSIRQLLKSSEKL